MDKEMVPIKGYEGRYAVSIDGEIVSFLCDKRKGDYRILKQANAYGYKAVRLFKGKGAVKKVHRLIAEAFIPNPENKPWINHKDGNRSNNSLDNIEWCTPQENVDHAFANNFLKHGEEARNSKLSNLDVDRIRELFSVGIGCNYIAKKFNVHPSTIADIKFRRTHKLH